jgi:hypothetical protein
MGWTCSFHAEVGLLGCNVMWTCTERPMYLKPGKYVNKTADSTSTSAFGNMFPSAEPPSSSPSLSLTYSPTHCSWHCRRTKRHWVTDTEYIVKQNNVSTRVYDSLVLKLAHTNVSEEHTASIVSPEVGGRVFIRNIRIYLKIHMALQPRRAISTSSPLWDQISYGWNNKSILNCGR